MRLSDRWIVLGKVIENVEEKYLDAAGIVREPVKSDALTPTFDMKEAFCRIMKADVPGEMGLRLLDWAIWVMEEGPEELMRKAERIVMNMDLITNWGIHRVSNSVCEGINKKAQDTRRQVYGYRNVQNFFLMILLRQGDFTFRSDHGLETPIHLNPVELKKTLLLLWRWSGDSERGGSHILQPEF